MLFSYYYNALVRLPYALQVSNMECQKRPLDKQNSFYVYWHMAISELIVHQLLFPPLPTICKSYILLKSMHTGYLHRHDLFSLSILGRHSTWLMCTVCNGPLLILITNYMFLSPCTEYVAINYLLWTINPSVDYMGPCVLCCVNTLNINFCYPSAMSQWCLITEHIVKEAL